MRPSCSSGCCRRPRAVRPGRAAGSRRRFRRVVTRGAARPRRNVPRHSSGAASRPSRAFVRLAFPARARTRRLPAPPGAVRRRSSGSLRRSTRTGAPGRGATQAPAGRASASRRGRPRARCDAGVPPGAAAPRVLGGRLRGVMRSAAPRPRGGGPGLGGCAPAGFGTECPSVISVVVRCGRRIRPGCAGSPLRVRTPRFGRAGFVRRRKECGS